MSVLIKILFYSLFLHYVVPKFVVEFTFNAIPLGHSGILITWKPNITTSVEEDTESCTLVFKKYIIEEKIDENFKFDDRQSHTRIEKNNEFNETLNDFNETMIDFNETRNGSCSCSNGQFKIHSLNESTLYEIIVHQYAAIIIRDEKYSNLVRKRVIFKKYSVKMRTTFESKQIPEKPYFEYIASENLIRWYPCGKERICHDQQKSGTHFGITIKEPYNTRSSIEISKEEFDLDYMIVYLWPGRMYEVVVFSINGECQTNSDSQDIFMTPMSSMVQYVNVISLPDSSVLLSWRTPKMVPSPFSAEFSIFILNRSESNADKENPILARDYINLLFTNTLLEPHSGSFNSMRIFGLEFESTYDFIILPIVSNKEFTSRMGFEYRMNCKLQVYNNNLPIAKPDFNYKLGSKDERMCSYVFQWLPCGQSFNCENTRPGSNYSFEFRPAPWRPYSEPNDGLVAVTFEANLDYYVSVTSSIGNDSSSKSEIKYLKACNEI